MENIHVKGNTYVLSLGLLYLPYYKVNDRDLILLDTGLMKEHRGLLTGFLEKNNYSVKGIICSHAHIDHLGNAQFLKERYGAVIAMSREEAMICSSTQALKILYSNYPLSKVAEHYGHMVTKTDILIENSDVEVRVCGIPFGIVHTPGHSSGHISMTTPDNVTYLGDCLISHEIMDSAKLPYAHILKMDLESKMKLYELKSDMYIVTHKGIYQDITELITDNICFYKSRAEEILGVITKPMTAEDILKAVSKSMSIRIGTINKYLMVERMLRCYVEYLFETGKLVQVIDDGFLKYARDEEKHKAMVEESTL